RIVVDCVRYPDFGTSYGIGAFAHGKGRTAFESSRAHRAVIDLTAKTLRSEVTLDRACEFPTIAPGRQGTEHSVSYLVLDELRGIGKLHARTNTLVEHVLPDTQRITEPLFVPRANARLE